MTMVVDYGLHQYAASTMSLETSSGSCGSRASRVRTIRLVRPNRGTLPPPNFTCRHGPSLGFSLRGGREHGTGFFVSYVEPASEAYRQGLKVGDQIIRVNGFTVEDAVHKEVLQLISNHTHLTLKVRRVGMIPVKERKSDSLSWQIITDNNSMRLSPSLGEKIHDVRISIIVSPRSKLGCGICKGPEWKPGIFVQFTKDGGIAREAGLRPGDQILVCNNVDFSDIPFNEAVNIMKMSRQLDLIVRKGGGSELFPGESSGYNSSASSVTGDQSPSWSDSKRLSIVKEENLDLEDRLDRLKCTSQWNNIEWDELESEAEKPYFKPTIINLSENGTIISNNGSDECQVIENIYGTLGKQQQPLLTSESEAQKTKTVVVDVHRSDVDESNFSSENGSATPSNASFSLGETGCRNSIASCSLSSALSLEIQRRSERKKLETKPSIDEQLLRKKGVQAMTSDKQSQHSKLMDEFKKAHKKMFKSSDDCENNEYQDCMMERIANSELSHKLSERLSHLQQELPRENGITSNHQNNSSNPMPPPPPPLPLEESPSNSTITNGHTVSTLKPKKGHKPKAPPVPEKRSSLSFHQPPPCPTPDYDTLSISSSISIPKTNGFNKQSRQDTVEMESLESFELYSSPGNRPRPPDIYFSKNSNLNGSISSGTSTLKKQKPVSVTIGEYGNGTLKKQPGKLEFLQNGVDEVDKRRNQPISSQLASELAQTLNRSNLRRRTESMANSYK